MIQINHYIMGSGKASSPSRYGTSVNPYNQESIATYPLATADEVDLAVQSAQSALADWRHLPSEERGRYLNRIADETEARADSIAAAITASCGKPITEAGYDVQDSVDCYRYYASLAASFDDDNNREIAVADAGFSSRMRREPVGVVGLITPWNFPTVTTSWKLAPALAAGCTAVLKPSEYTALPESFLAEICAAAGIPAGVVNIIYGEAEAGSSLVNHPGVKKISFTGSTATGTHIARACADDIKNLSLELGGKSPIIVFNDADIDLAVDAVSGGILFNNGQMCSATSRLLVQQDIAPQLLQRLADTFAAMTPSDPASPECRLGPLANQIQFGKVCHYFSVAEQEGLKLLTGGRTYPHERCDLMVEPTIYSDVPATSQLWNEEIFGPVLCCQTFTTEDDAVARANDCEYGLAATVISGSDDYSASVAERLEAGHIWINTDQRVLPEASWGGMKKSGLGRELGPWGLHAFTEIKHITRSTGAS